MLTAKLFTNGSSQAVRLPKEVRFNGTEVYVQKVGSSLMLVPKDKAWETFLEGVDSFTDDYFDLVESHRDDEYVQEERSIMKYMLDTNMCIYAQKKNESVLAKIKENYQDGIAISVITLAELEYGVKASAAPEKNSIALMKFLSIVDILPFDTGAAEEYGNICADLRRKETPIGNMDMLISAHAKSEGLTVVTHNTREFERVQGLKLEDWYE